MSLFLNGAQVKGHSLNVSATLQLAGEDMSGQGSLAAMAETGDKPKQLAVRMEIKQLNAADLTALILLAESKDELGERTTYNVRNATAKAMNIRQVRFLGDVAVSEDEALRLWKVSFKLTEVKSVPELKQAREKQQPVDDLPATDEPAAVPAATDLERFENLLKWLDDKVV